MFPDRVRARRSSTACSTRSPGRPARGDGRDVPFSTRLHSDRGAGDAGGVLPALRRRRRALRVRAGGAARFTALGAALQGSSADVIFPDGSTGELNYSQPRSDHARRDVRLVCRGRTSPQCLADVEAQASAGDARHRACSGSGSPVTRTSPSAASRTTPTASESFPAWPARTSDNPDTYAAWSTAGHAADAQYGYFGRIWTWASRHLRRRGRAPTPTATSGPLNHRTANPVLVVGNLFDPATRYQGAVHRVDLLPNSRAADGPRLGPHVAVPLAVRRRVRRATWST